MQEVGHLQRGGGWIGREGRQQLTVEQRPVGEDQRRAGRRHVRAEQHQRVDAGRGERGQEGQALRRATRRQRRRVARRGRPRRQQREQRQGGGEVRGDPLAGVVGIDGDLAQVGLEADQRARPGPKAPRSTAAADGAARPARPAPAPAGRRSRPRRGGSTRSTPACRPAAGSARRGRSASRGSPCRSRLNARSRR